jgi:thiol-disulfide isomerase/thioredoxin
MCVVRSLARVTGVSVLTSLTAGYAVCYIGCMKTMGLLLRGKLTSVLMLVFGTLFWVVPARAFPAKGTPAPPLTTLQLLQAPMGTRSDWDSLRGKVVVLEFWATWCAPCIASLPHLNQLVEALDPTRFQFISIDDEDLKVVQAFLAKKKIGGWVGVDSSGSVFARYGVRSRPTTIVVDARGKIVAATQMDDLNAADLEAVAEGKNVAFKPAMEIVTQSAAVSTPAAAHPLFSVSFGKAAPGSKFSMVKHPPTGTDFLGVDAGTLLTYIYDPIDLRAVLKSPLPEGLYNLRVELAGVPNAQVSSIVQTAVFCGLHLQVKRRTITKREYILRATDASQKLLNPSASNEKALRGYWNGRLVISKGSMDDLAFALETGLENPVINQTGIEGKFDARFNFKQEDIDDANAALRKTLGLELVPGTQDRSVTLLEVVKQEDGQFCTAEPKQDNQ